MCLVSFISDLENLKNSDLHATLQRPRHRNQNKGIVECLLKQEPWRLPSRQAEFNVTDRLGLDACSDYQAVASNKGYFELKLN